MASNGLFIGFGTPVRGREQAAIRVFGEYVQFLQGQMQQGNVSIFEPVFLRSHGGDLNGFFLVRGDPARLDALTNSDEFQRLVTRANAIVEHFGVVNCSLGDEVQRQVGTFLQDIADLTS